MTKKTPAHGQRSRPNMSKLNFSDGVHLDGGTFSGNGGTPSQGRVEDIFRAATICHYCSTRHIPIFEIPRILATVYAWRPFLINLLGFLIYPGFTKSAQRGPHRPRPVSVNVRGP